MSFNWTCPHCETPQTVTNDKNEYHAHHFGIAELAETKGYPGTTYAGYALTSIGCSNAECMMLTVKCTIGMGSYVGNTFLLKSTGLFNETLYPSGTYRSFPDYIPQAIREDYTEACLIASLSPKASATLSRRCIQGMIRDFCGISKARLIDEIRALREAVDNDHAPKGVDAESIDAIDHVRGIGNIGAHMERDVDHIVPVDPDEARALIDLIEMLLDDWYISRESRRLRLARIESIGLDKQQVILAGKQAAIAAPTAPSIE